MARRNRTKHNKKRRDAARIARQPRPWEKYLFSSVFDWGKAVEKRDTPFITHILRS
jgi:hypothetical protein